MLPFDCRIVCLQSHNERKVTCKHPVTGQPSQDNCIFVVNEQTVATMTSEEKKERPVSMINEASNYNMTADYAVHPMSPVGRTSRASKKVHNFGKRSNSIKRNPNAPVVRRGWLYKQDSTGMKLWKKRWFVLSDLCLFYYRGEFTTRNCRMKQALRCRSACKRLSGEWSWYQDLGLGRKGSRTAQKEELGFPAVRERPR
nr:pleckstrin homology domain-containing family A member 5-like [Odocoileus virginianus texanus]